MASFDSAKSLLSRADQHLVELDAAVADYGRANGEGPFADVDSRTGKAVFKFRVLEAVPLTIGCIAFDIVNEIRSALDYAVFDAAVDITGIREPSGTKFPFGVNASDARRNFDRKTPPPGLDEIRDFIVDTIEPYQNGRNDALWRLNNLRNDKIHRQLAPAAASRGRLVVGRGQIRNFSTIDRWDSGKKELSFLEADYASPDAQVESTLSVSFIENSHFPRDRIYGRLFILARDARFAVDCIERQTAEIRSQSG